MKTLACVAGWLGVLLAALPAGAAEEVLPKHITPETLKAVRDGLEFLGIEIDEKQNLANMAVISTNTSRVTVHVIHTDEEWMIANTVFRILGLG